MEDMSLYAEKRQIKKLLHEYLSRVVSAKPDEPLAFLIEQARLNSSSTQKSAANARISCRYPTVTAATAATRSLPR